MFTWGSASYGRLGHNCVNGDWLAPAQLGRGQFGGGRIVFVAAGGLHTVAVTEGGVLWVWGDGSCGQLGLGDRDSRLVPTRLGPAIEVLGELGTGEWEEVFWGSLVHVAACGHVHTLVVTEEGAVWVFGRGEHGRLGLNDEDDRLVPTRVGLQRFAGARVATVAAGAEDLLSFWGKLHAPGCGCIECTVDVDRAWSSALSTLTERRRKNTRRRPLGCGDGGRRPIHLGHR